MAVKLTKNELRLQQNRLTLLVKYLPTLQLKKAMLQGEVNEAKLEMSHIYEEFKALEISANNFSPVLTARLSFDILSAVKITEIKKHYENIAGVEVPYFDEVLFAPFEYTLFDTPAWVDVAISELKKLTITKIRKEIAEEKKQALEKELREVSIRVNLFEKVLIPRAKNNIKVIKVFLGDQQLAAVSRAKVAKTKIEAAKLIKSI